MGRKKREPSFKTTIYYLESDLNKIDAKNRFLALKIAKEISLRAVSKEACNIENLNKSLCPNCEDCRTFLDENNKKRCSHCGKLIN